MENRKNTINNLINRISKIQHNDDGTERELEVKIKNQIVFNRKRIENADKHLEENKTEYLIEYDMAKKKLDSLLTKLEKQYNL